MFSIMLSFGRIRILDIDQLFGGTLLASNHFFHHIRIGDFIKISHTLYSHSKARRLFHVGQNPTFNIFVCQNQFKTILMSIKVLPCCFDSVKIQGPKFDIFYQSTTSKKMVDQKQTPLFRAKANLEIRSKACQPLLFVSCLLCLFFAGT